MTLADRALEHRNRSAAALRQRRWLEAEQQLQAYLVLRPNDPIAWNNLGLAAERLGRHKEAAEAYARASALMPGTAVPGTNLMRDMQRYLGFPTALVIFRIIEWGMRFVPLPPDTRTGITVAALVALVVGAFAYYVRRRDELPEETWRAYKSAMARTRRLRYGGVAFVFAGFLVFALVLLILVLVPGGASDGTVVLVIVAGLCWMIVAQLLWRHLVRPWLESGHPDSSPRFARP